MKRLLVSASSIASILAVVLWQSAAFAAINITDTALPSGDDAWGVAVGPDGNLWFTGNGSNKVLKETTGGTVTAYTVPTSSATPWGIAAGPDGNLWITENTGNKIAKLTTSGTFTEYTIPTSSAFPQGITAGPDGNMWFTEENTQKIGKITTSGTITEYSTPSADPQDITAGPDGNLWITEGAAGKIAKVTTSGGFTEYSVPTSSGRPQNITAGPDGNLWFTERTGDKIGKITTSGTVTEYSIPTANSTPWGITKGPDNDLWFVEGAVGANKVGRITTAGVITEYSLPTASAQPQWNITTGPDGNIWFGEYGVAKVATVLLPKPVASAQTVSVVTGKSVTVDTLSGATNNPDPSTVTVDSGPSHGTATVNSTTGAITYTPTAGYTGTDSLSFVVCSLDDSGLCSADPVLTFNVTATATTPDTGYGKAPTRRVETTVALVAASILLLGAGMGLHRKYSRS